MKYFLFITCFALSLVNSSAQIKYETAKARKRILKSMKADLNTVIMLDDSISITEDEFINYYGEIARVDTIGYRPGNSPEERSYPPRIFVTSMSHFKEIDARTRLYYIREYRTNELRTFFGKAKPLIQFGNDIITEDEFLELKEQDVAFINYYFSDYVKSHYAPNGMVYVCPRTATTSVEFLTGLPIPAIKRNYMNMPEIFYDSKFLYKRHMDSDGKGYTICNSAVKDYNDMYIRTHADSADIDFDADIIVACKVNTQGCICPILVERIDAASDTDMEKAEKCVDFVFEIINSMPEWDPADITLFNIKTKQLFSEYVESSVSVPVSFRRAYVNK